MQHPPESPSSTDVMLIGNDYDDDDDDEYNDNNGDMNQNMGENGQNDDMSYDMMGDDMMMDDDTELFTRSETLFETGEDSKVSMTMQDIRKLYNAKCQVSELCANEIFMSCTRT